jgi:CHAP domain
MRSHAGRRLLSTGIAPVLALAGVLVSVPSAGASATPTMTVTTTTVTCVNTAQKGCTDPIATIRGTAQVQVICSRGSDYYVEDLAHRAYEGYVPKSRVRSAPAGLVDCDTASHPAIFAAANGLGNVGQTNYAQECLEFAATMWREAGTMLPSPPLGANGTAIQWWQAYENNAGELKGFDYAWDASASNGRFMTPPRGALVFWWGNNFSSAGHVAVALGNGWVVSTSTSTSPTSNTPTYITTIASITAAGAVKGRTGAGSGTEAGWVMPVKGYQIQS